MLDHGSIKLSLPASRVRLSKSVLSDMGLSVSLGEFESVGYIRSDGELLVYPLVESSGVKGLGEKLLIGIDAYADPSQYDSINVPPPCVLVAHQRIFKFKCTWTPKGNQLDLCIGGSVIRQLGLPEEGKTALYPIVWSSILIILTENAHHRAWEGDIFNDVLSMAD